MILVLVGARGAGKTTVGRMLAQRVGARFIDLDHEVEELSGRSVIEIFSGPGGEAEFRRLEEESVAGLAGLDDAVVATGGGVVLSGRSRKALRSLGLVAWLQVAPAEAARRTKGSSRPRLTDLSHQDEIELVIRERAGLYDAASHVRIHTDGRSPQEVCDELESLWRSLKAEKD